MNENRIEHRLKREVEKRGGRALKLVSPGTSGVPDRLVLLPGGKTIFVELKAPGEILKPLQRKRATELKALGFQVYKIDSDQAIDDFLTEVFR
jgi:hypothetical protein